MLSVLKQVPLFAGFSANELADLDSFVRPRRYPKSSIIFHQGDPGTTLYLVEAGEVKLTVTADSGKEVILALLGPGAFFGELSLLDGDPVRPMRWPELTANWECWIGSICSGFSKITRPPLRVCCQS